ncbi:hypothetical protein F5879DRAFT_32485 [Lentinula edodes]|nr:hypothetical protein F5879DRAFT_32485 [Lentinula edodes]
MDLKKSDMGVSDLFETYYFTYYDEPYLDSDDEDDLFKFTSMPDRPLQALRLIRDHLPEEVIHWEGTIASGLLFHLRLLDLRIEQGGYACRLSPRFTVIGRPPEPGIYTGLEAELKRIEKEDVGAQRARRRPLDSFHFSTLVLRMVEAAAAYQALSGKANSPQDINLDSIPNTAQDFLGVTPTQICKDILPEYRVVHIESIIRKDLSQRFLDFQDRLRSKLMFRPLNELRKFVPPDQRYVRTDHPEDYVEYIVKPKVTFHGTRPDLVPSIVQYGFLKPGSTHPRTGTSLPVRCGSTYGRGIYSSPNSAFSLAYSGTQCQATKPGGIPGLKLLVCATIMGRHAQMTRGDNWRDQSKPYPGSDSHIANNGQEYIVFDNAQILPCYVVHLDWESSSEANDFVSEQLGRSGKRPRIDNNDVSSPGDRQRLKENRLAQARKFFAYGFGPVSGSSIVIEDIADIEDDEEDYGEFQADRLDDVKKVDIWTYKLAGETDKDEYSSQRKTHYRRSRTVKDEKFLD